VLTIRQILRDRKRPEPVVNVSVELPKEIIPPVPSTPPVSFPAPEGIKVFLSKLPPTDPVLFGREKELEMLDEAWEENANVISLIAWGGVGKTALVNNWLLQMGADDYREAEQVYGWSFYSQGTSDDSQASADPFIAAAPEWFGDPDPTAGSPWDKGERLAQLIRKQRTLLILDGLEPLQYPPGAMEGRLRDPGLQCLLRELCHYNPGLCVITTRLKVGDLMAEQKDLDYLSPEAGAQVLSRLGVDGTQAELEKVSADFGGHALALTLLGTLLKDRCDGDARRCDEVVLVEPGTSVAEHARKVMNSYEIWLGEGAELGILGLIGLFDHPADKGALDALRKAPIIRGLTDKLFESRSEPLSDREWERAVTRLRHARLLLEKDVKQPGTLDAHPLVREHFGEKLREGNPGAWREAHSRLYEYYRDVPEKHLPDTLDEMMPLYAAVAHGCQAGLHKRAYDEVYDSRILRGDEYYSTKKLGAFGADLAAISGFFHTPWSKAVDGLTEENKAIVLNSAGFYLRALGRLAEAAEPMQAALENKKLQEDWEGAAVAAGNLSELHLTMGEVAVAVDYARQSVDYVDRSGDWQMQIVGYTTLADALHQQGKLSEAEAAFIQAEGMQKEWQSSYPLLYSLPGFRYCDLLLAQGKHREALNRAGQTLKWAKQAIESSLLDIALNHLSLGRARLLQAGETGDFSQASAQLDRAVDGLRESGQQWFIPPGLLARAELHRVMGNHDRAQHDLDEAMTIATRGGMRLYEADCHLESARLHLAMGKKDEARESLAKAKEMIDEMGYHRRDGEVRELEEKA